MLQNNPHAMQETLVRFLVREATASLVAQVVKNPPAKYEAEEQTAIK